MFAKGEHEQKNCSAVSVMWDLHLQFIISESN